MAGRILEPQTGSSEDPARGIFRPTGGLAIAIVTVQTALFSRRYVACAILACVLLLSACADPPPQNPPPDISRPAGIITLGDIDPDEPATRVRRIQPIADHLAEQLGEFGIGRGRVVVARDIDEMARLLQEGKVDYFLDSPYPVLAVNRQAGSRSILLRQAKSDAEYWTVLVSRHDAGINNIDDIKGKVSVFQEPHSTSGFLLPVAMLLDYGMTVQPARHLDDVVGENQIGCQFSGDEENTIELVLNGDASVGAISNQDLRELPQDTRERLTVIDRTQSVPRQLVAERPGIDPALSAAVRETLLNLSAEDRDKMAAQDSPRGWTWRFAPLTKSAMETLASLESKMDALPDCFSTR